MELDPVWIFWGNRALKGIVLVWKGGLLGYDGRKLLYRASWDR
jgi:hypothetical protein